MHTTADERALWMIVLGIGLVVCIVVIVLLWLLISIVYDIDERVAYLWTVTKRTAINTTGLYQFAGTGSILRALREELLRHEKLLSRGDRRRGGAVMSEGRMLTICSASSRSSRSSSCSRSSC